MLRVLVTNIKGGCGKTTIATNLAGAFATSGLRTALADVDRQHSSLDWLKRRGREASPVVGLDWRKKVGDAPVGTARLVIDAPANLRMAEVKGLIEEADLIILPILPSLFDESSTKRFLSKLAEIKPIRKNKKAVLVVANRVRPRTRARERLDAFLEQLGEEPVAVLQDRAIYGEVAINGQSLFDLGARRYQPIMDEWRPLLRAVDDAG